jgi:hypothetical protein
MVRITLYVNNLCAGIFGVVPKAIEDETASHGAVRTSVPGFACSNELELARLCERFRG